jgi:hypothetical protein
MYKYLALVAALACSSCTSISCYYKPSATPPEVPVGTLLEFKTQMVGMLDQWIDDSRVYHLNITPLPGYSNRFVKTHVEIPAGTRLKVVGARKATNPMCHWQNPDLVLQVDKPLEPSNSEINIDLSLAIDPALTSLTTPAR